MKVPHNYCYLKRFCFRFWETVQQLKTLPQSEVQNKVSDIWSEFLAPDASCPINVDSHSYEITKKNMENSDRWSFDTAAVSFYFIANSIQHLRLYFIGSRLPSHEK